MQVIGPKGQQHFKMDEVVDTFREFNFDTKKDEVGKFRFCFVNEATSGRDKKIAFNVNWSPPFKGVENRKKEIADSKDHGKTGALFVGTNHEICSHRAHCGFEQCGDAAGIRDAENKVRARVLEGEGGSAPKQ